MKAEHPTLPTTDVLVIERSEHKTEIFGLLCAGTSPARTSALILQRYGETISVEEVTSFATQIPEQYFLEPGELQKRLKYVDVEIDLIGEMSAVLRYYKTEVEVAILTSKVTHGQGTVTADTRKLMNQYWTKLAKFAELKGELGLEPVANQKAPAPAESQLPSLRSLLLQQNVIVAPEALLAEMATRATSVSKVTKEAFVDAEVKVLDAADREGS